MKRPLRTPSALCAAVLSSLLVQNVVVGDDAKPEPPATHTVKAGPFRIDVEFKGMLRPERVATIKVDPEEWATLKVVELADQGATVEKGDVILAFETEDLDKQIRSLKFTVKLAELSLLQAERELEFLTETAPLDLELAKRTKAQADEDLAAFFEEKDGEKALTIESAKRSVENSEFSLEYASEELKQLKQMYEEDDLTEETEEMILKRTERSVKSAERSLRLARIRSKRLLETSLPRQEISVKEAAKRADIALRKAVVAVPTAVDRKKIELAKQRYDLEQSRAKLEGLESDREQLVVRAPADGVVYHGTWKDGIWSLSTTLKAQLKVGGTLPARTPVMAIVRPQPLSIRTTIEEKQVAMVENGLTGTVTPTAFPQLELGARVKAVSSYPVAPGKFGVDVEVDTGDEERLVPGMNCAVKITAYEKEDAITVPASAVFSEGGRKVVYVVGDDGEAESRAVKTGRSHGGKTEILEGLAAGDTIRTKKP